MREERFVDFGRQQELRYTIPEVIREEFAREPRIVIKLTHPAGLWPVDPGILMETNMLEKWAKDPAFRENFEIVIMPNLNERPANTGCLSSSLLVNWLVLLDI